MPGYDFAKDNQPEPVQQPARKIGAEHAKGMLKLGAHELTPALAAFPDSTIRPMEEPGVFGNESMPQRTPPSYDDMLNAAANKEPRQHERGRDH